MDKKLSTREVKKRSLELAKSLGVSKKDWSLGWKKQNIKYNGYYKPFFTIKIWKISVQLSWFKKYLTYN